MESPTKADAINGSPQKTAKPRDFMPDVSGASFASNRSDRAETIEDIISELNATARPDAPAPEALGVATMDSNGDARPDSLEQCDRNTESLASSPECIEGSDVEALPTTRDEGADVPFAVSEDDPPKPEYVLPDLEYDLPDTQDPRPVYERVPPVSEGKDPDGVSFPQTSERASQDAGETVEPAIDELSQILTQRISEPTPDDDASAIISAAEPKISDEVPNENEDGLERSDGGIKVPDERVQSPRRTSRQRVATQKLIESNQNLKSRHGSGTSDVSSAESSPVKNPRLYTSDSDSDVPLAQRVRKRSGNRRPATSDSDSESPLAQRKRRTSAAEDQEDSTVAKRLSFGRQAKGTPQVKKTSPAKGSSRAKKTSLAKSAESPRKKGSVASALTQNGESKEAEGENPQELPQASENAGTPKKAGSAKKKSTPTSANKSKSTPANKSKRKSAQPEVPVSIDSTSTDVSPHQDGDASSVAPKSKKARGKASKATVTPADSQSQDGSAPIELPKQAKGKASKAAPSPISSPPSDQSTAPSKPKKGKRVISISPGSPTDDHGEVDAVPGPKEGKRKSDRSPTSPEAAANEENERPATSKRRSGTTSAASEESEQPTVSKRQKRGDVTDGSDTGQGSNTRPLQAANRVCGSSVQRETDHIPLQSSQATTSQPSDVLLWSFPQFSASDRLLRETIQVGLRGQQPVAGSSYLTIEVPSANARRSWGPTVTHRRPTVVLGGCNPYSTYVNLAGTRVPLQQWQHVSKITPTIRLTDIFKTFSPA